MRFSFLTTGGEELNAIEEATGCLARAVERAGHQVRLLAWSRRRLAADSSDADVLVVPYNPFMWRRWGYAPDLVRDIAAVRRARPRPLVALVVHEPYVPITSVKSLAMGGWQRAQLVALLFLADESFASIQAWAARFGRLRRTTHLPSGSNLPDARAERAVTRVELDAEECLVVASLSTGHPSHLAGYVEDSLTKLAEMCPSVVFLQLGSRASAVDVPEAVRVVTPGHVSGERLAALVAAADLFLSPFIDGVSTRRTSFMAGLCEAVAVVGTTGALTDPMLLGRGLELVDVGSSAAFAARVTELATDADRRNRAAAAGRNLFDADFTWDVIAARFLDRVER